MSDCDYSLLPAYPLGKRRRIFKGEAMTSCPHGSLFPRPCGARFEEPYLLQFRRDGHTDPDVLATLAQAVASSPAFRDAREGSPVLLLLQRAWARARAGRPVRFAPLIAGFLQALDAAGSLPAQQRPHGVPATQSYVQARQELERCAGLFARGVHPPLDVELAGAWRCTLADELREYRLFELDRYGWFSVFVRDSRTVTLEVHPELTVALLLELLHLKTGKWAKGSQMRCAGFSMCAEERTLWDYGVQRDATIHCCGGLF